VKVQPLEKLGVMLLGNGNGSAAELDQDQVVDLFKTYGLVLFRNMGLDLDGFNRFTGQFSTDYMSYKGGGYVRGTIKGREADETLLSTRYDYGREKQDTFGLPLHGEMYYIDRRPVMLWFYCERPADKDGETTVCDGSRVYDDLSADTKALFAAKRLKYTREYHDGEWQVIYQTDTIEEAEKFATGNGLEVRIDHATRTLHTDYIYPAVIKSRWGDHNVYINNLLPVLWQESMGRKTSIVRFEDGATIPQSIVEEITAIQARHIYPIPWQKQDFVMVDNTRVAHGRRAFEDQERSVHLRMVRSVPF
jgi:alpha-ketoglutarate-dependent taurine dioxygenase